MRPMFPELLKASLEQVKKPDEDAKRQLLIFWSAVIGLPTKSELEANAIESALMAVGGHPSMNDCLLVLKESLTPIAQESVAARCVLPEERPRLSLIHI